VFGQVLAGRPYVPVRRRNDAAAGEGHEEAGHVGVGGDLAGGDDGVGVGYSHHPFVEGPVAELAQGHAVADVVVLAFAPGDDMGGIHHGVLFRRDDPHPAEGAAVVVGLHHDAAEALITGRRPVAVRLDDLLHQRQVGLLLQQPAVVERLPVDHRLLPQQQSGLGREARLQQRFPQCLSPIPALHDPEQPFVQLCAQGVLAQVGDGGGVIDDRRGNGRARLRHQFPERFTVETGEGKGDAACLAEEGSQSSDQNSFSCFA